jgi:2-succinyl-6-hydroxy-2,4-cyclohexadiene-1-carboxylate synthase
MSLLGIQRHGSGPLLVWLHGFTQTKDSAHEFRTILAGTNEVLTIDLPGHGLNATTKASLDETADLLSEVLPDEPFVLAGYSFGARVSLHFALHHPKRLRHLVLLGATRGIEDTTTRQERREHDEALAARIMHIGSEKFLVEWLSQPMFSSLPGDVRESAARSCDAEGLAWSLRLAGTGTQRWLGHELENLDVSTLAMAGALDAKFAAEATAMAQTIPEGSVTLIAGAHHAAHLERPRQSATSLLQFIASRD